MLRKRGLSDRGKLGLFSFFFFSVSLALTSYSAKNPKATGIGRQAVSEVVRPFDLATKGVHFWFVSTWDRYLHLVDVEMENEHLRTRLGALEQRNALLEETKKENERLQGLLNVKDPISRESVAATVIGYDPSSWVQAVTLNKGSNDNIELGLPVISGGGVVGQVIAVSPHTSRVLLIIDRASGVDVMLQDSRARGILEGTGGEPCDYQFVIESEEVNIGDKVVTTGLDGVFPKGINVGVVTSANAGAGGLFRSIKVTPAVKFSKLEDVLVLLRPPVPAPVEKKPEVQEKPKTKEQPKKK